MSVSKKHVKDARLVRRVLGLYRRTLKTMNEIAQDTGTTHATISRILADNVPAAELRKLKALKYSQSKAGERNPMSGQRPHNFIGVVSDGRGYATALVEGKRQFVHRTVMSQLIGISVDALPSELPVHHIDGDRLNNHPDNLALTTNAGHRAIHQRYVKSLEEMRLDGLTLAEAIQFLISRGARRSDEQDR